MILKKLQEVDIFVKQKLQALLKPRGINDHLIYQFINYFKLNIIKIVKNLYTILKMIKI